MSGDGASLIRIVDDQDAVREAIADLLASIGLVSRGYVSPETFLESDDAAIPGCAVLDVRMSGMSGFDLLAEMRARGNELPVVFVTGHGDVAMAVRAMKAGAVDFLTKPFDDQQLIDAVNAANRVDATRRLDAEPAAAARRLVATLSDGEREVFDLTIRGLPVKRIATALGISEITVKVRRARVLQKMGASTIVDLVRLHDLGAT